MTADPKSVLGHGLTPEQTGYELVDPADLREGVDRGDGVLGTLVPYEPQPPGNDVFLPKLLKHLATYWAPATSDGYGGKTFAAPVQIVARWEERTVLFVNKHGREAQSQAVVMVGADLNPEGYLMLGASIAADPLQVGSAHEIQGWDKVPNFKGKKYVRKAFL